MDQHQEVEPGNGHLTERKLKMLITGTKKIKGALDLAGINKQLTVGSEMSITDEEFHDHTVQTAIKMGMITYKQGSTYLKFDGSTHIKLKNIHNRPIAINALTADVRPGDTFNLSEEQINNGDIRAALAKGMIEIVSSVRVQEGKETSVKIGDIFKTDKKDEEGILETISSDESYLETNEELPAPKTVKAPRTKSKIVEIKNVIDTEDPDPVSNQDIQDPKKEAIVWNPNKEPIAHTTTKMKSVSVSKEGITDGPIAKDDVSDDISFVDKEVEEERKASHPKLKDQPSENNNELDFVL